LAVLLIEIILADLCMKSLLMCPLKRGVLIYPHW